MLRTMVFAAAALISAGPCFAAVAISVDEGTATPGLPGFKTVTLTALSDYPITAIDFVGDGRNDPVNGYGFFGPMNHVNPLGQMTVFQDVNDLFASVGAQSAQDSQFLVRTSNVVVPPGFAEEGPEILQAAWAWPVSPGSAIPFAQLVIRESETPTINYRGAITALVNGVQTDFPVTNFPTPPPVPPIVADVNSISAQRGTLIDHPFITTQGSTPINWDNLMVTTPGGFPPVIAPSLTSTGQFNWQTTATDMIGTYHFDVTATNAAGSDVGRLTVNLLPDGPPPVVPVVIDENLGDRQRGGVITRQLVTSQGTLPISWNDLVITGPDGALPLNEPTLSSTGLFQWQSSVDDSLGIYSFDVTASNIAGSDTGRITVQLVPPTPPIVVDRDLGSLFTGGTISTQLLTSAGAPPITWDHLALTTPDGSEPVNAPSLTPNGVLFWRSNADDVLGVYHFDVTATNAGGSDVGRITVELMQLPMAPEIVDANLGHRQLGDLVEHQFFTMQGTPPIEWGDLVTIAPDGATPANQPSLSPTGELQWQTSPTDVAGTYHFEVSATNSVRGDRGHLILDLLTESPQPGSPVVVDADLGIQDAFLGAIRHQFTTSEGETPVEWSDLIAIGPGGGSLVNAPTLSASGEFSWTPHELDVSGRYYFDVLATNASGSDFGHLTLEYFPHAPFIPEPATWYLFAIGMAALHFALRRPSAGNLVDRK